jgi:two-component system sensor histidine kinase KdpD
MREGIAVFRLSAAYMIRARGIILLVKITEGLDRSRGWIHWLVGTGMTALTTVALILLGANATVAGMIFVALVVWSATQAGIWLSLYVALLSAFSFDFFFLQPYHTLRLAGAEEWVALVSLIACCLVVGRVAERARSQTHAAEQRREDVERLYELSQEMMLHDDAADLMSELPRMIHRIFGLDGVLLYVRDHDRFYGLSDTTPASAQALLRTAAHSQIVSMHADFYAASLMLGLRPVGALGWQPADLSRQVATAVSAQVSIVLARSMAIEASTRIEAARESERLRTALIDSLTHELRTPLTSIRAAATTLIEGGNLDAAARNDLVMVVDEEASRLDQLIGEAVEMAEIDANVVQVNLAPHHARALLDEAVDQTRQLLADHRVNIAIDGPETPVWFDAHLLHRVLRHLIENAAHYTPPASLIVLKSWRTTARLEFSVEDNGPGIDALDLPLIFEKFYRGKTGSLKRRRGSGMGLAICRALLTAHGGGIQVESVPSQGTRFHCWVPLIEKEPSKHS